MERRPSKKRSWITRDLFSSAKPASKLPSDFSLSKKMLYFSRYFDYIYPQFSQGMNPAQSRFPARAAFSLWWPKGHHEIRTFPAVGAGRG
jgi:hypothetical protein